MTTSESTETVDSEIAAPDSGSPPDGTSAAPPHGPGRRSGGRRLIEWVAVLAVAALVALGLRTFVVQTFYVPSGSMLPTLQIGDRMLVDKLPHFGHAIHRGDIIVFHKVAADTDTSNPTDLVKRVIGLPHDTVSSRGHTVFINGKPLKEPWLPNLSSLPSEWACAQTAYNIPVTHVAPGHYFVMGDCRGNSSDSRAWGTVPVGNIIGRVFVVLWRHNHPWFHWF